MEKVRTAIILAGGLGTRLRSVIPDQPKVLAPVAGQPFLHYVLSYLKRQGINEVILSVGHLAEKVREVVGYGTRWGLSVRYVFEQTPLGTGGALRLASQDIKQPFVALNGDTLFQIDLDLFQQEFEKLGVPAALALKRVTQGEARGCVILSDQGIVEGFTEKPVGIGSALVNGGVYLLREESLSGIEFGQPVSLERQVFPELASQGLLAGFPHEAYFIDIGTPESLAAFERDVLDGRAGG